MSVNANELFFQGKDAIDKKDYETAIELLEKAQRLTDDKKVRKELEKAYEKQAVVLNKLGDQLYKKKKYQNALDYYKDSIDLISKTDEQGKRKSFVKEFQSTCEKLGKEVNKQGDDAFKSKKYDLALRLYEESLELAEQSKNDSIIKEFTKELQKTYEKIGESLGAEAKSREFDADKAIKLYEEALTALERSGNTSKIKNLMQDLSKFFEKQAEKINKNGDQAFKEKRYEDAIELYSNSIELAKKSKKDKLLKNFKAELDKTFEAYAKQVNEEGDKEFRLDNWPKAANIYRRSVELAKRSKKEKVLVNFQKELTKTNQKWADQVNKLGDKAFKEKKYEVAVDHYTKSVDLMREAGNESGLKKYKKELNKAMKKLDLFR